MPDVMKVELSAVSTKQLVEYTSCVTGIMAKDENNERAKWKEKCVPKQRNTHVTMLG